MERDDVIIVSSVSCIYGLGSVDSYSKMTLVFKKNESYERDKIIKGLVVSHLGDVLKFILTDYQLGII
jgi:excinuclease ABC subunit B